MHVPAPSFQEILTQPLTQRKGASARQRRLILKRVLRAMRLPHARPQAEPAPPPFRKRSGSLQANQPIPGKILKGLGLLRGVSRGEPEITGGTALLKKPPFACAALFFR